VPGSATATLGREAVEAIEPDLLALEQLGSGPCVGGRARFEGLGLARELAPALGLGAGARGGGLAGTGLQHLEIGGDRRGPDGLRRAGQAVLLLGAVGGEPSAQARDLGREVERLAPRGGQGRRRHRDQREEESPSHAASCSKREAIETYH